ncbi:sulfite exporter TauE/SafE family protein, partial [Streptomyces malaysiense]|uniref:sulfite exporter TauE/SafE family protein n=1 Tax=Streptomyces malaysiense TaxID=1428626 RepID=UPI000621A0CB
AGHIPQALLTTAFSVIAALAALRMLRPARTTADPTAPVSPLKAGAAGAGLGAVTGFLGVGGGFLAVPALVSVLRLPMRRAVGTSLLVITINSLAALAARAGTGTHLDWAVVAPFTAAAMLGAWDGKRLSRKLKGNTLQRVFAWVLLAVAAFMLADTLL